MKKKFSFYNLVWFIVRLDAIWASQLEFLLYFEGNTTLLLISRLKFSFISSILFLFFVFFVSLFKFLSALILDHFLVLGYFLFQNPDFLIVQLMVSLQTWNRVSAFEEGCFGLPDTVFYFLMRHVWDSQQKS